MSAPAVPSTLKPHLFAELLGIPRRHLSAERLSLLFLAASRQLPEVLALAFCNRIEVKPRSNLFPYGFVLRARNGLMFEFTDQFHIPALLRVAGRYVQTVINPCPEVAWMEPFYEGLAENTRLEYIGENVGLTFLKRYSEHHEWFPKLKLTNYSVLDELAHANINTLQISGSVTGQNKRQCRAINVEVVDKTRVFHNPLCRDGKIKLYNCADTLKRVEFFALIMKDLVPKMINVTFSAVDELIFHDIIGMQINGGEERDLNGLTRCIKTIWASMLNHSGTVIACIRLRIRSKQMVAEFQSLCRKLLKEFEIESNGRSVNCRLQKVCGASFLECLLNFCPF